MDKIFWSIILEWYSDNARSYPWRNSKVPFHILIAEMLLQQTNARTVPDVYTHIVKKYNTPSLMADAEIGELSMLINPLGLHYRAKRIIDCAKQICLYSNYSVPDSIEKLIELPGVGQYIANAVLCYAYDQPTVPIDTNVIRLFKRFFGLQSASARERTDRELHDAIRRMYDFEETRVANLAVLDYAGVICAAKKPKCSICLLSHTCSTYIEKSK